MSALTLEATAAATAPADATTLPEFAQRKIEARLHEALYLSRCQPLDAPRLCGVLSDAIDRARALALTSGDNGAAESPSATTACATLRCSVLAAAANPVSEFLLIPFGRVEVERPVAGESFEFTRAHAEAAVAWFGRLGRKLAIDYEHQSLEALNSRSDGLRPAAGWIGKLESRDDGLWAADIAWTPRAADLLRSGEYRYFSPVIFWEDEQRAALAGLGPVALTNDPAMHGVQALAASSVALATAREEIDDLRRQLAEQGADAFIARGERSGKIVAATRADWRDDFLRDAEQAEARLRRAPIILPPGRVLGPDGSAQTVHNARKLTPGLAPSGGAAGSIEAADLDAYERAASAGYVRYAGVRT